MHLVLNNEHSYIKRTINYTRPVRTKSFYHPQMLIDVKRFSKTCLGSQI